MQIGLAHQDGALGKQRFQYCRILLRLEAGKSAGPIRRGQRLGVDAILDRDRQPMEHAQLSAGRAPLVCIPRRLQNGLSIEAYKRVEARQLLCSVEQGTGINLRLHITVSDRSNGRGSAKVQQD